MLGDTSSTHAMQHFNPYLFIDSFVCLCVCAFDHVVSTRKIIIVIGFRLHCEWNLHFFSASPFVVFMFESQLSGNYPLSPLSIIFFLLLLFHLLPFELVFFVLVIFTHYINWSIFACLCPPPPFSLMMFLFHF